MELGKVRGRVQGMHQEGGRTQERVGDRGLGMLQEGGSRLGPGRGLGVHLGTLEVGAPWEGSLLGEDIQQEVDSLRDSQEDVTFCTLTCIARLFRDHRSSAALPPYLRANQHRCELHS